jgi:hypothetical protein
MDYNRTTRRKKGEGRKGHNWLLYFFSMLFSSGISIIYKPKKYQTLHDLCLNGYMERQLN